MVQVKSPTLNMFTNMWIIHTRMRNHLWRKYCLDNEAYNPFVGLKEELRLIPEKYHAMYLKTQCFEDAWDYLMSQPSTPATSTYIAPDVDVDDLPF
jgi:hypothetical protein